MRGVLRDYGDEHRPCSQIRNNFSFLKSTKLVVLNQAFFMNVAEKFGDKLFNLNNLKFQADSSLRISRPIYPQDYPPLTVVDS